MLPTNRPPTHPGEMLLKEFLEPLGVSQVDAAKRMNIPFQRLNAIIKGRRGVSADTALLFEALTRWDAEIWLTFQAKWDLWHAMRARGIVRRSERSRKPLSVGHAGDSWRQPRWVSDRERRPRVVRNGRSPPDAGGIASGSYSGPMLVTS